MSHTISALAMRCILHTGTFFIIFLVVAKRWFFGLSCSAYHDGGDSAPLQRTRRKGSKSSAQRGACSLQLPRLVLPRAFFLSDLLYLSSFSVSVVETKGEEKRARMQYTWNGVRGFLLHIARRGGMFVRYALREESSVRSRMVGGSGTTIKVGSDAPRQRR